MEAGAARIQTRNITSPMSLETVEKINRRSRRRVNPRAVSILYDKATPKYRWLLPGWVAEERVMEHNRVYTYYYDPEGKLYSTQQDVLAAWDEAGYVVVDM